MGLEQVEIVLKIEEAIGIMFEDTDFPINTIAEYKRISTIRRAEVNYTSILNVFKAYPGEIIENPFYKEQQKLHHWLPKQKGLFRKSELKKSEIIQHIQKIIDIDVSLTIDGIFREYLGDKLMIDENADLVKVYGLE